MLCSSGYTKKYLASIIYPNIFSKMKMTGFFTNHNRKTVQSSYYGCTGYRFSRYPTTLKAGYRISGGGRLPNIRPDFELDIQMSSKTWNKRRHQMYFKVFFSRTLDKAFFLHQSINGFKTFFWNLMNWYNYLYNLAGYPAIVSIRYPVSQIRYRVSGRITGIKKAGLSFLFIHLAFLF
jgi:hypothetical protein